MTPCRLRLICSAGALEAGTIFSTLEARHAVPLPGKRPLLSRLAALVEGNRTVAGHDDDLRAAAAHRAGQAADIIAVDQAE